MNRFEQLIEYVINDEEQKARELFHDIFRVRILPGSVHDFFKFSFLVLS